MKVLSLFAQQDVLPDLCWMKRRDASSIDIEIDQHGLTDARADLILQKLRQIIGVERAILVQAIEDVGVASREPYC